MNLFDQHREVRPLAYETKFLVSVEQGERVKEWARQNLSPDPNAVAGTDTYSTTSLYLDTPEMDVMRRTGSYARSKYRVRCYNESDRVYLERKLKTRGQVAKWRSVVERAELAAVVLEAEASDAVYWFARRLAARRLAPVCQIRYQRMARVAETKQGLIRLTLDEQLGVVPAREFRFGPGPGEPVLDGMILELKYRGAMPALFARLLAELNLTPGSVSKYRLAMGVLEREAVAA